jgi:formiminoglutamase
MTMADDPKWPRASRWLASTEPEPKFAVLGVPAHETSISHTSADRTPGAVRSALSRYSTYSLRSGLDLMDFPVVDLGDVVDPDHFEGELRVADAVRELSSDTLLFALGGDNSITYSVMNGLGDLAGMGLVTLDAHFDLRDGISNGSPVRRLIDAGLDPHRIVQIGLNDFSNSADYAHYARDMGITVFTRDDVAERGIPALVQFGLDHAAAGSGSVYVDLDIDVCDRSVVPACPAAAPGGISAFELRQAARIAGADHRVRAVDATEVDATQDAPDARTTRLVALCLLEAAAARQAMQH